jgi:hypothetical protein
VVSEEVCRKRVARVKTRHRKDTVFLLNSSDFRGLWGRGALVVFFASAFLIRVREVRNDRPFQICF